MGMPGLASCSFLADGWVLVGWGKGALGDSRRVDQAQQCMRCGQTTQLEDALRVLPEGHGVPICQDI